jgi:hypothetical protein
MSVRNLSRSTTGSEPRIACIAAHSSINTALTAFWAFVQTTHQGFGLFTYYPIGWDTVPRIGSGILFFYVIWGVIW